MYLLWSGNTSGGICGTSLWPCPGPDWDRKLALAFLAPLNRSNTTHKFTGPVKDDGANPPNGHTAEQQSRGQGGQLTLNLS